MNRQTILFLALITFCLASFSYRETHSAFTSGAMNNGNSFTAITSFPTASPAATLAPTEDPTETPTPTP